MGLRYITIPDFCDLGIPARRLTWQKKEKECPDSAKIKKLKKGVDFPKSECYYKQAVADKTAENTIRHHVMSSKKSKEIKKVLDKDETKWYHVEVVAESDEHEPLTN